MCSETRKFFRLRYGQFGSPEFDEEEPLFILCADGAFSLDIDVSKPGPFPVPPQTVKAFYCLKPASLCTLYTTENK